MVKSRDYSCSPNLARNLIAKEFEQLKENVKDAQLPCFKPSTLHCDYEKPAINAALETERRLTGLISTLPLLPKQYMKEGREYIKMESLHKPKMQKFLKYINTFWMKKNFTDILCVFGQSHRTNNITESYHSQIN
ncbi:Uncharacterized protein OBRU01_08101 [Operophtera brumata]|uniref:Uncharacterized protein n=1 Tax=Operophtera brumata TaxID=104452 RepID=A0A0L7LIK4_OPEBR|nr:Uncharacterized protein OBRU01_08101 [Operophtera brumata]